MREKAIRIFNLPESARPAVAAGPLALVDFAYDMEDGAEGIRIWGPNPCDADGWEIGQVVFERWWFIFDREIVEQSNRLRALRGAPRLTMKSKSSTSSTSSGSSDMGGPGVVVGEVRASAPFAMGV